MIIFFIFIIPLLIFFSFINLQFTVLNYKIFEKNSLNYENKNININQELEEMKKQNIISILPYINNKFKIIGNIKEIPIKQNTIIKFTIQNEYSFYLKVNNKIEILDKISEDINQLDVIIINLIRK